MKLAVPVTHPDQPDQDLLKAGFILRDDVIARLRELAVEIIFVDYPELADLDRHMAGFLSPARQQIYAQVRNTIAAVQKTAQPTVAFPDYYSSTRELVLTLMQQGQHAIYLDQMSGRLGLNAVAHATSVAHLSLMLGLRLEQYLIQQRSRLAPQHAREVINLGVAGMLHDIGAAALPEKLRNHSRAAQPNEAEALAEWQTHPQRGYDMIKGGVEASAAAAVLQHHQHFDGSGFPAMPVSQNRPGDAPRNAGQQIHVFARIIAIADLFDRLTAGPEGQRRPNVEILYLMRTKYASWFDPKIMEIVPSVIPPFPPGMKVTLNDGTLAVTVGFKPDKPYRPMVKRIQDAETMTLAPELLDLSLESGITIEKVGGVRVHAEEPPPVAPEPQPQAQASSLPGLSGVDGGNLQVA